MKKPSFLERLTGSVNMDDEFDDGFEDAAGPRHPHEEELVPEDDLYERESEWHGTNDIDPEPPEGELPIDMYQTGENIVIRALVAGVDPDDLDIGITRDMVTIKGKREEYKESADEDYFHRELFWGGFTRAILLPEEILIDEAEAREKHGLLEIILPKVDKDRSTQLKVKTK